MKKIVVLGAGLVGKAMILDLAKRHKVLAVDISEENLVDLKEMNNVATAQKDISNYDALAEVVHDAELVIGAVPGFMGYQMVKDVIKTGNDIVDISFFPENPIELDQLAKQKGVTAIVDCGVSPGMGNIILGHHLNKMNVQSYKCMVGGLPVKHEGPWGYKAVFSPIDVIEEYIRPVRIKKNGKQKIEKPLSRMELVEFNGIGTFEAWNTDGLRTLLETTNIPNLVELTIRHTGTIQPIIALRDTGYFSYDEIDINGKMIRPIDLTSKLMFSEWNLQPGEHDMTLMRIEIKGDDRVVTYDLVDYYDQKSDTTSMARTTGYTCTSVANLLLEGKYDKKGIIPPEILGQDEMAYNYIVDYLAARNVIYTKVMQ